MNLKLIFFVFIQIEGAFVQGYGMFVMEDYRVTPGGHLLTSGPGFYKIPGFDDIPAEFNVSLLTRAPNPFAICSSKVCFLSYQMFWLTKKKIPRNKKLPAQLISCNTRH